MESYINYKQLKKMSEKTNSGIVKFYKSSNGYGFIKDDESGKDIFVHVSGLNDTEINEGDAVTFDLKEGKKGINAINVKVI